MCIRLLLLPLLSSLFLACPPTDTGPAGFCELAEGVSSAGAVASVDGAATTWDSGVLYDLFDGPGLFVEFPPVGGVAMTLSLQTDATGRTATQALNGEGAFEADVGDRATDGASLTVTRNNQSSDSSDGTGGRMRIEVFGGDEVAGCFEAATDEVNVTAATFRAQLRQ